MSRLTSLIKPVATAAALGLLTLEASAQTLPWVTNYQDYSTPAGRERVFCGTDGNVVYMYGGQNGSTTPGYDELYSCDGYNFTLLTASGTGAGPRTGGASCYDVARGKFVVFGGKQDWINNLVLNDTWEWDATNGWVQVTTATVPNARWLVGDSCAYVPGFGLVFHGGNDNGTKSTETWAYDGTNWTLLSSAGPDRQSASLAYRPVQNDLILYGGVDTSGAAMAETWSFDLGTSTWTQITTATLPGHPAATGGPGLQGHVSYYNPLTGKVVIYGGNGNSSGGNASHMTWEFDGTDWADATDPAQLTSENCRNGMAQWVSGLQSAIVACGNRNNGSYYSFILEHGPWGAGGPGTAYCFGRTDQGNPCPCGNDNDGSDALGAGCAHDDSAAGARLSGSGVASVIADTLLLEGIRGPISNSTLFFQANNNLDGGGIYLGDGLRCAGGGLIRLKVKLTDASGYADSSPSVITTRSASFGHTIVAGETLYYQWWFRDTNGSPCGAESNTSNGYMVTWGA